MATKVFIVVGSLLAHIATASFEVYAYGQTNDFTIDGQQVFYADGLLKITFID